MAQSRIRSGTNWGTGHGTAFRALRAPAHLTEIVKFQTDAAETATGQAGQCDACSRGKDEARFRDFTNGVQLSSQVALSRENVAPSSKGWGLRAGHKRPEAGSKLHLALGWVARPVPRLCAARNDEQA